MSNYSLSSMVSTALSTIRCELNGVEREEAQDFEGNDGHSILYRRTVSAFSPRQPGNTSSKRSRGRPSRRVQIELYLLNALVDVLPTTAEQKELERIGLGNPKNPAKYILRSLNLSQLKNYICQQYPNVPLELVGFTLAKSSKRKKLSQLEFSNVSQLKKDVGRGRLYIIPKRDITKETVDSILPLPTNDERMTTDPRPAASTVNRNQTLSASDERMTVDSRPTASTANENQTLSASNERMTVDPRPAASTVNGNQTLFTSDERMTVDPRSAASTVNRNQTLSASDERMTVDPRPAASTVNRNQTLSASDERMTVDPRPAASTVNGNQADEILPSMQPRQRLRRNASRLARRNIREWCNRNSPLSPSISELPDAHSPIVQSEMHSHSTAGIQSMSQQSEEDFSFIEVVDSEDEDLQRALQESLTSSAATNIGSTELKEESLEEALKNYRRQIVDDKTQEIIISRRCIINSAFRAIRHKLDPTCNLYVKFSGEMGLDHGGPKREFFRLAMKNLSMSSLFEGNDQGKMFSHNLEKLEDGDYRCAGILVGMSILHDGPGLKCLHENVCKLMTGLPVYLNCLEILSGDSLEILEQLRNVDNFQKRDQFLEKHGEWLLTQGFLSAWQFKPENRNHLISSLMKQIVFYRTSAEIAQFQEGLNIVCGLWQEIKRSPLTWMPLFCHKKEPLSREQFSEMIEFIRSPDGSNKKIQEEDTIYSWEIFLQDIHNQRAPVTFEELLIFITGADEIPICGFSSKICIEFFTNEEGETRLPFSSTCALSLSLPRGISNPESFSALMVRAIKESSGFDKC
nr:uncharacterized protein LOC117689682 isoform X2 [Crassostrea gigas]